MCIETRMKLDFHFKGIPEVCGEYTQHQEGKKENFLSPIFYILKPRDVSCESHTTQPGSSYLDDVHTQSTPGESQTQGKNTHRELRDNSNLTVVCITIVS